MTTADAALVLTIVTLSIGVIGAMVRFGRMLGEATSTWKSIPEHGIRLDGHDDDLEDLRSDTRVLKATAATMAERQQEMAADIHEIRRSMITADVFTEHTRSDHEAFGDIKEALSRIEAHTTNPRED